MARLYMNCFASLVTQRMYTVTPIRFVCWKQRSVCSVKIIHHDKKQKRGVVVQLPRYRGHCFSILILCPTTAASAQFCLLCCQPEPIPRSLTARMSRFTSRDPCRLAAWLGRTIHMGSRAYRFPLHSNPQSEAQAEAQRNID